MQKFVLDTGVILGYIRAAGYAGYVLNAALLAIDHDFDHLSGVFLDVLYIDQNLTASDA